MALQLGKVIDTFRHVQTVFYRAHAISWSETTTEARWYASGIGALILLLVAVPNIQIKGSKCNFSLFLKFQIALELRIQVIQMPCTAQKIGIALKFAAHVEKMEIDKNQKF